MAVQDAFVHLREALLRLVLNISEGETLNAEPLSPGSGVSGTALAAEIKSAMNAFKAAAMDARGEHVDYAALAQSAAYAEYRAECSPKLRSFDPAMLRTRAERLAFWINLYNALIIDAVIFYQIRESVAKGLDVFRFFRRAAYQVGGLRMTAEDIEHGVLRANRGNPYLPGPQFGLADPRRKWVLEPVDPRIHFALNCASKSCPPVGVYTPEGVDAQLDLATRNFLAHEVQVERASSTLVLSQIFKWYSEDFGGKAGIVEFVANYLPDERDWLRVHWGSLKVKYTPYDWGLNL